MRKIIFSAIFCLLALLPLCLKAETIPATDTRVTFVGRTAVEGTSVSFDWTATYFRIAFSGDKLTMRASETKWDATPEEAATRHNYYSIWIDSPTSAEPYDPGLQGVKGVIFSAAHVKAWIELGAPLANENFSCLYALSAKPFHSKVLGQRIAGVTGTGGSFFVCH